MATTMITDDDANDDAIVNQTSRSWAAFALFCERQSLSVRCKILAVLDLEHFYTLPQRMIIICPATPFTFHREGKERFLAA